MADLDSSESVLALVGCMVMAMDVVATISSIRENFSLIIISDRFILISVASNATLGATSVQHRVSIVLLDVSNSNVIAVVVIRTNLVANNTNLDATNIIKVNNASMNAADALQGVSETAQEVSMATRAANAIVLVVNAIVLGANNNNIIKVNAVAANKCDKVMKAFRSKGFEES
jgi:hypothetical protein